MSISAKVICDSKHKSTRLITLEIELHRFILSEVNTHRALSRNFQSSRAMPIEKMLEQVRTNAAYPVHWGKNKKGMQANEEVEDLCSVVTLWEQSARIAANQAEILHEQGLHKQVVNRLLEPFMWTKGVVTATQEAFNSMFLLRLHKDAQPEFRVLAEKMKDAIDGSTPNELKAGEWHLPYVHVCSDQYTPEYNEYFDSVDHNDSYSLGEAINISTSCCAQVSYRKLDTSLDKALSLYDMLNLPEDGVYKDDPPHFSPTEHIAMAYEDSEESGNFHTPDFVQYRKMLEGGIEKHFIH